MANPVNKLPPEEFLKCERCGIDRSQHHAANLADGAFVGEYLLICPTALFSPQEFAFKRKDGR